MKVAERKIVQKQCEEIVEHYGAKELEFGRYELETNIGKVWIRVDTMCKSKVQSLFVRFENTAIAKKMFGHWKVNLHKHETNDFPIHVKWHLVSIFNKLN